MNLMEDIRDIAGLYGPEDRWQIVVGRNKVTGIQLIKESGSMGHYAWFMVFREEGQPHRVNSLYVESVTYIIST